MFLDVQEVGSEKWMQQHDRIEKLNMQALSNASKNEDEFVKEFLVSHDKLPLLVTDLIVTSLWKKKVLPKLFGAIQSSKATFPFYFILYHELTVITLLECVLYHSESCQALEDACLDLVDYCYTKVTSLLEKGHYCNDVNSSAQKITPKAAAATSTTTALPDELHEQNLKIDFQVALKALTILRFIIDNLKTLPLCVSKCIYSTLDVPVLLVELAERPPWVCEHKGVLLKHDGSCWKTNDDVLQVSKLDGQVWLGVFQLLVTDLRSNYHFTSQRKRSLMRLRPYLNDLLIDQLPMLMQLQHFLDQLAFYEPDSNKSALILEQLPEIRTRCLKRYKGRWQEVAEKQLKEYFSVDSDAFRRMAKSLSETYSLDNLENFISQPARCVVCGEKAPKKCSRCHNEWYCRRQCQVSHWNKHKKACDIIATGHL